MASGVSPSSCFEDAVCSLKRALGRWDVDNLGISGGERGEPILYPEDLATNWKTHLENWGINVLHEAFVHDLYDQSPEVPRMRADGTKTFEDHVDDRFMALKYREAEFPNTYPEMPFPGLARDEREPCEFGYFGSFLPNLHVGVFSNLLHLIISIPVGACRTRTLWAQFYRSDAAKNADLAPLRAEFALGFVAAGEEDGRITEAVQRGRASPAFSSQYYSQQWDEMHYRFSQWVLEQMLA